MTVPRAVAIKARTAAQGCRITLEIQQLRVLLNRGPV